MNPTYTRSVPSPISSFRTLSNKAFDIQDARHPVRDEISRSIGEYNFTAVFEEDIQTIALFKHVPGLIAFICTLKRGTEVVGQGRGTAVLSKVNRYVDRTVRIAFNAALIDAVVRSTKALDVLNVDITDNKGPAIVAGDQRHVKDGYTGLELPESFSEKPVSKSQGITAKQRDFLRKLVTANVKNELERDRWESEIDNLTSAQASQAIKQFVK